MKLGWIPGRYEILSSLNLYSSSITYMRMAIVSNLRGKWGIGWKEDWVDRERGDIIILKIGWIPGQNEILSSLKLCSSSITYMRVAIVSNLKGKGE